MLIVNCRLIFEDWFEVGTGSKNSKSDSLFMLFDAAFILPLLFAKFKLRLKFKYSSKFVDFVVLNWTCLFSALAVTLSFAENVGEQDELDADDVVIKVLVAWGGAVKPFRLDGGLSLDVGGFKRDPFEVDVLVLAGVVVVDVIAVLVFVSSSLIKNILNRLLIRCFLYLF